MGDWKEDAFHDWLIISLIVGFMGQVMFMGFSFDLFDTMFDEFSQADIVLYKPFDLDELGVKVGELLEH